jgi:drug/metabolite transporter (DMT)-like permease
MFMLVKLADEQGIHIVESLFYRYLIGAVFISISLRSRKPLSELKSQRMGKQVLRAFVGMLAMGFNFWAYTLLPLADASIFSFTIPIISTILSIFLLSEKVGLHRWAAILLGFAGVLIAVQPGQGAIPLFGASIAIIGAAASAYTAILVRQLSTTDDTSTILLYYYSLALPVLGVAMFFFGSWPTLETLPYLIAIGVTGLIGMFAYSEALRYASFAVIAPADYSKLIFSTLLGYLIWEHWPAETIWLGIPFIIASGVYIGIRERTVRKEAQLQSQTRKETSDTPS